MPRGIRSLLIIGAVTSFAGYPLPSGAQQIDSTIWSSLPYRYIGPVGNRVISVVGIPDQPFTYYVGGASGGVWKTTDGGTYWEPIFDDQDVSSIGALAIPPTDPNIVWAGTGEPFIRSNISIGNGIYKSTDAGKNWKHMGLGLTGRIARIVIDPRDPNVVFACALGHSYGPQPERGVFRTTDGGENWERVLFVDEDTGCSDIAMDPNNPRILIAGTWQLEIHTWGRISGGPGGGLHMSRDGGDTWARLEGHGLPELPVGKIAVGFAPSNSERMYALIETGDGVPLWNGEETESGELWRSDDGGENWQLVSYDRNLAGRTHYYSRFAVAPDDENEAWFLSAAFSKTLDGGETTFTLGGRQRPGGDYHDMWIDPTNGDRMIVGNDGGVGISINRGESWHRSQLPLGQLYHVDVDQQIPYNVYGNRQDGPSTRGPSNSRLGGGFGGGGAGPIPRGMWHSVGGGESGNAVPDPVDNNIIWSSGTGLGAVGGTVERYDERTRQGRRVEIWPERTIGYPAGDVRYRFNWTFPVVISPHDHNRVYAGSQHVHQTTDGGSSWQEISPDLTTNDKSRQVSSGGLTPDNLGVEYAGMIFAIDESPVESGVIWAGTNDGQVQLTRDGGATWTNVTSNIPDLPPWGTVSNIDASRYDAGTAYIAVDFHQVNIRDPYLYKTNNYGESWRKITDGIPHSMLSYTHVIREDPVRQGLLYAGTENAIYVSLDDGENWHSLQNNLPHSPLHWIVVQEHFNDLVIATYGRGFWILDDITPLQQLTSDVLNSNAHLFAPRQAYRFQSITSPMSMPADPSAGRNPPYGAAINYYLSSQPEGDVGITISNASGETVRTLTGTRDAGINRVQWDLRYDATTPIRLRTSPLYAPEVRVGADGTRPLGGSIRVLAPPGTYTVTLAVGGEEYTQPLTVLRDPNTAGTLADVAAQTALMLELRDNLNEVVDMIHRVELVRSQLTGVTTALEGDETAAPVRDAAEELERKFIEVEENLFQMRTTGRGQDSFRWPSKLVERLTYLSSGIGRMDFAPTMQHREVHGILEERIRTVRALLEALINDDLAAFNDLLRARNIRNIIASAR